MLEALRTAIDEKASANALGSNAEELRMVVEAELEELRQKRATAASAAQAAPARCASEGKEKPARQEEEEEEEMVTRIRSGCATRSLCILALRRPMNAQTALHEALIRVELNL